MISLIDFILAESAHSPLRCKPPSPFQVIWTKTIVIRGWRRMEGATLRPKNRPMHSRGRWGPAPNSFYVGTQLSTLGAGFRRVPDFRPGWHSKEEEIDLHTFSQSYYIILYQRSQALIFLMFKTGDGTPQPCFLRVAGRTQRTCSKHRTHHRFYYAQPSYRSKADLASFCTLCLS